jgi:catechol 2,3-dioxygenase-like lactoylglutathione lyase family enzyme
MVSAPRSRRSKLSPDRGPGGRAHVRNRLGYGWGMTTRLDVIGLVTADMARSLAFYRSLGLELPSQADDEPHVELELPGGLRLAWDTVDTIRSFDAHWTPASGGHRMSLAFACDDPAEVDATYRRLVDAGHQGHLEPFDAFWGMRYATVLDPDGNVVDLFASLPGS